MVAQGLLTGDKSCLEVDDQVLVSKMSRHRDEENDAPVKKKATTAPDELKSWKAISEYLHKPVTTVKRWSGEGMPVKREGRFVTASKTELAKWLGEGDQVRGSVHVTMPGEDLTADLRKALTAVKKTRS